MLKPEEILSRNDFFSDLTPDSINLVIKHLKEVVFKEGEFICHEGDVGDSMYMIAEGMVSVRKDLGWGQRELLQLGPNEAFGEMSLISKENRSATVMALSKTICLRLDSLGFTALLDLDSHFAQQVSKVLTRRLADINNSSSNELLTAYRSLMFAMAHLTESRDPETGAHLKRTRHYCVLLAEKLAPRPRFAKIITPGFIAALYDVAPMHDIGKVAIPDAILLKPERLTSAEYEIIKTHTTAGAEAFQTVLEKCNKEFFQAAYNVCLYHHEKWDGSGYPEQLAGDEIPLEARIMSVADIYDALLSKRVYKPAMTYEATQTMLRSYSGTFFDPEIVEVMLENITLFEDVHKKYQDDFETEES